MKKIAITGVIGSGKSYVGKMLVSLGYDCLDLDKVAKQVRDEEAKPLIEALFHSSDPLEIGKQIFNDEGKMQQLNKIMHPLILDRMLKYFDDNKTSGFVFVEIPLLYELGWETYFDYCWCVSADEKMLIERLINYRGFDIDRAIKVIESQMSIDEKTKRADYLLDNTNNNDPEGMKKQILKGLEIINAKD